MNTIALKQICHKAHGTLLKFMKRFKEVLAVPSSDIIHNIFTSDEEMSLNFPTRTQISSNLFSACTMYSAMVHHFLMMLLNGS